jgi:Protein of unknown function (DUF2721)
VNVETITRAIQFILAPVVMVTSCAILVGGMLTLYVDLKGRLRALAKERLELLRGPDGSLDASLIASDAFKSERLREIDVQLPGLLRRHTLVHHGVLAIYLAVMVFVVSMLIIAVAVIPNSVALGIVALSVFLLGTAVMLVGVVLISLEVRTSNEAVRYEVERVMSLGHTVAPVPS